LFVMCGPTDMGDVGHSTGACSFGAGDAAVGAGSLFILFAFAAFAFRRRRE
jgi:MYXO-CTERM domain-containing protein